MIFACPVCGESLRKEETAYRCPRGHSYDIAAEGYVYLLPPNKKHSRTPGDNKQMVASRRAFLEAGYYLPFSDCLNGLVRRCLSKKDPVILDAGCGEGWYTGRLQNDLSAHGFSPELFGFDISKSAVKAAAKKYREISFAVGSMFGIPAADGSCDCVTDVFAPIVETELRRVLKPGGFLILAVPGPRHLFGLKKILYDAPYKNERRDTAYRGFRFVRRIAVRSEIRLRDPAVIEALFAMTPYYWKTPVEGSERLRRVKALATPIGFDFLMYQKEEGHGTAPAV